MDFCLTLQIFNILQTKAYINIIHPLYCIAYEKNLLSHALGLRRRIAVRRHPGQTHARPLSRCDNPAGAPRIRHHCRRIHGQLESRGRSRRLRRIRHLTRGGHRARHTNGALRGFQPCVARLGYRAGFHRGDNNHPQRLHAHIDPRLDYLAMHPRRRKNRRRDMDALYRRARRQRQLPRYSQHHGICRPGNRGDLDGVT